MKNLSKSLIICILSLSFFRANATTPFEIQSPDQKISFSIQTDGSLSYSVRYQNQAVVEWSKLGITCNGDTWDKQLIISAGSFQLHDTIWTPVYGEHGLIRDQYNESIITKENRKNTVLQLVVRAYNSGIAFRYKFATKGKADRRSAESTNHYLMSIFTAKTNGPRCSTS